MVLCQPRPPLSAAPNLQRHEFCRHADWPQLRRSDRSHFVRTCTLRIRLLNCRLYPRTMAMDDLPRPAYPTKDVSRIPASQEAFQSVQLSSVIDKVKCQERYIYMTQNIGIVH